MDVVKYPVDSNDRRESWGISAQIIAEVLNLFDTILVPCVCLKAESLPLQTE